MGADRRRGARPTGSKTAVPDRGVAQENQPTKTTRELDGGGRINWIES
jgi:hypothetical protein